MEILNSINELLDRAFFVAGIVLILGYPLYFFTRGIGKLYKASKKENQNSLLDLVQQTGILLVVTSVLCAIWAASEIITYFWFDISKYGTIIRLAEASLAFFGAAYGLGHEYGEKRWFYSAVGHIAVLWSGYLIGNWPGAFFFSCPIIITYYVTLYNLALILLPSSDPEDRAEQRMRFNVLFSYTWGIQSPLLVAGTHAWKSPETRIPGDFTWDFSDFPMPIIEKLKWRPGMIWTPAHQVASITAGTKFRRVEKPGISFLGQLERPEQIFDLRLQLRTNEIAVISKDGINFKARVFTAFRIDPEAWSEELYDRLRPMNPTLRGADKLTYTKGSFPFSAPRVQATLGVTSTKATPENPIIYWDQWVLNVIEDHARKIVSKKNLDEMWRPAEDKKLANALDAIARELKESSEITLRAAGILLVAARVVNFNFLNENDKADEIMKQQLTNWGSEWERERVHILSEAQARADHAQQEARAYATSTLLNSIADGLQKTELMDKELPRYVIAMHFLSSLQDFIHKQPDEKTAAELQAHFKEWQTMFFPESNTKEK